MAITIDYIDPAEFVINVPKADLTLISSSPTEIRQLNIDDFRKTLNDLMDDAVPGIVFPTNHFHTPPLTISGVTLARVVEILDPYVVLFEDDQYNVNIVGGNSNISDKTVKNQVGVNTANSAGLQDPFALQAGAFGGRVALKASSGFTGTTFPVGSRSFPVDNLTDAVSIAVERGLVTLDVIGNFTIGAGDFSAGYIFRGDSAETTTITIDPGADVTNCTFSNCTVQGTLDGDNIFDSCNVLDISMSSGLVRNCGLAGTITLLAGTTAQILGCYSEIPGAGPTDYPLVDLGGAVGTDLLVRDYNGGLGLRNCSDVTVVGSLDMSSGRVVFEATVAAGAFTVRGISDVTDLSTGTAVVTDDTLTKNASSGGIR